MPSMPVVLSEQKQNSQIDSDALSQIVVCHKSFPVYYQVCF